MDFGDVKTNSAKAFTIEKGTQRKSKLFPTFYLFLVFVSLRAFEIINKMEIPAKRLPKRKSQRLEAEGVKWNFWYFLHPPSHSAIRYLKVAIKRRLEWKTAWREWRSFTSPPPSFMSALDCFARKVEANLSFYLLLRLRGKIELIARTKAW